MIRGWCPTVHAPMQSGDGLLVRVKPFGGRISSTALGALADAAAAYGNGVIELTRRGNLQIRGVRDPVAFARAMVAAGLADPDPDREARRNVVAVPPCDDALVAEAEATLAELPGLPPKFHVVARGSMLFLHGRAIRMADLASPFPLEGEGRGEGWPLTRSVAESGPHPDPPPQAGEGAASMHLLYLPFGQTDGDTLKTLATLAPEIRTTPWRAFLSPVPAPGFLARPSPITACPGAPACSSGTVPARADAARLQAAGLEKLHISGCAKGCAYPAATTTLVGRDGRYDLIRHGRAGDTPDLRGLTLTEAIAAL
jgi:precorrin-3B synthase